MAAQKLAGKVAVITGGSTGIGLATAKLFVENGAYVFITGRNQQDLDDAVKFIGSNVTAVRGDVSVMEDLDHLYQVVRQEKGKVDIVFANAGTGELVPLANMTPEHFDKTVNVNLKGVVFTVQKALPLLSADASIIVNASASSVKPVAGNSIYSATKSAVRMLIRCWILEMKSYRFNIVSPGPVDTPLIAKAAGHNPEMASAIRSHLTSLIPIGRMGQAEEIAKAVLFLASSDSSFINGVELFRGWRCFLLLKGVDFD